MCTYVKPNNQVGSPGSVCKESRTAAPEAAESFEQRANSSLERLTTAIATGPKAPTEFVSDILMDLVGLTPAIVRSHHQYFNSKLGACVESILLGFLQTHSPRTAISKLRDGRNELADIVLGAPSTDLGSPATVSDQRQFHDQAQPPHAIEVKYRYGSLDYKHLKSTTDRAKILSELGYQPLMWIFRDNSAPRNLRACRAAGWEVVEGPEAFDWLASQCQGARLDDWLVQKRNSLTADKDIIR